MSPILLYKIVFISLCFHKKINRYLFIYLFIKPSIRALEFVVNRIYQLSSMSLILDFYIINQFNLIQTTYIRFYFFI